MVTVISLITFIIFHTVASQQDKICEDLEETKTIDWVEVSHKFTGFKNVALNKTVSQQLESTPASYAVDGIIPQDESNGLSLMVHSGNWMSYPWLCVDLGKEALVYSVGIFNRYNGQFVGSRMSNFYAGFPTSCEADNQNIAITLGSYDMCGTAGTAVPGIWLKVKCTTPTVARYVITQASKTGVSYNIYELEVLGTFVDDLVNIAGDSTASMQSFEAGFQPQLVSASHAVDGIIADTDVGIVHTSNGPKADYPWLCVDLGEEAIIYSAGFYSVHGTAYLYRLNNLHIGFPTHCEADDQNIVVTLDSYDLCGVSGTAVAGSWNRVSCAEPTRSRYVIFQSSFTNEVLILLEIEVLGVFASNVAAGKPVTGQGNDRSPSLATDGFFPETHQAVFLYHSWNNNKGDYPWLCIDLEQEVLVYSIAILNTYDSWHYRHDGMYAGFPAGCLADNQGLDVELGSYEMCGIAEEAQAAQWSRVVCNQPTVARYVILQVAKTTEVLNAYEVEVYGKPVSDFSQYKVWFPTAAITSCPDTGINTDSDNYEQCNSPSIAFLPNTNVMIYCANQVTSTLIIFQRQNYAIVSRTVDILNTGGGTNYTSGNIFYRCVNGHE